METHGAIPLVGDGVKGLISEQLSQIYGDRVFHIAAVGPEDFIQGLRNIGLEGPGNRNWVSGRLGIIPEKSAKLMDGA